MHNKIISKISHKLIRIAQQNSILVAILSSFWLNFTEIYCVFAFLNVFVLFLGELSGNCWNYSELYGNYDNLWKIGFHCIIRHYSALLHFNWFFVVTDEFNFCQSINCRWMHFFVVQRGYYWCHFLSVMNFWFFSISFLNFCDQLMIFLLDGRK